MACEITITSVNVYGSPGQPISSVTVEGTAKSCAGGYVKISCGGSILQEAFQTNAIDLPVYWSVQFSNLAGSGCVCGAGFMRVSAYCKDDPACGNTWPTLTPPQCQPSEPKCPELGAITISPVQSCFSSGDTVKLNVHSNDPAGCIAQYLWMFSKLPGQCTGSPNSPCPGGGPLTPIIKLSTTPNLAITLSSANGFTDGNWIVQVVAVLSSLGGCVDCPQVASPLLPFSIQPDTCPNVTIDAPVLIGTSSSGFVYNFNAHITGNTGEARISWNFGAGLSDPVCLCGQQTNTVTHTYPKSDCEKTKTVSVLLEAGNNCCPNIQPAKEFQLPLCDGGGNGGGGHCPWWNPFCQGWNFCAAILALALLFVVGAAVSLIVIGCTGNYLAAFIAMAVYFVIAAALFYLWYSICARLDGSFCGTLDQLIHVLFVWIFVQPLLIVVVAAIAWLITVVFSTPLPIFPCAIGAVFSWAYFATIFAYLLQIRHMAHCPGEAPTHV